MTAALVNILTFLYLDQTYSRILCLIERKYSFSDDEMERILCRVLSNYCFASVHGIYCAFAKCTDQRPYSLGRHDTVATFASMDCWELLKTVDRISCVPALKISMALQPFEPWPIFRFIIVYTVGIVTDHSLPTPFLEYIDEIINS
jgi:hypothetical protein